MREGWDGRGGVKEGWGEGCAPILHTNLVSSLPSSSPVQLSHSGNSPTWFSKEQTTED